jgi:GntR family transcriptional regulator
MIMSEFVLAEPEENLSILQMLRLRHDTAKPYYQQLEEQLVWLIRNGRLSSGQTLPAERSLAEALGVSRGTVQQCYNVLRDRGLVEGRGRHGSVVRSVPAKLSPGMDRLKGFTQEMAELGRRASTRVLEREILRDENIAAISGVDPSTPFLKLVRLRFGDDTPLSFETAWYNLAEAGFLADCDGYESIYRELERNHIVLDYCDQSVEAILSGPDEIDLFDLDEPIPCLLIKRKSHISSGRIVEYVEGIFRGDVYTYNLRLNRESMK